MDDGFARGLKTRKEVLGDAHVERALDTADDFNRPFQEFITSYCWDAVWNRPGLPRHTRSLLNIAMMVALNREDELRLHLRASFNNGVTEDEIREVLLQAAVYCGVPAANHAFKVAREVLAERAKEGGDG